MCSSATSPRRCHEENKVLTFFDLPRLPRINFGQYLAAIGKSTPHLEHRSPIQREQTAVHSALSFSGHTETKEERCCGGKRRLERGLHTALLVLGTTLT